MSISGRSTLGPPLIELSQNIMKPEPILSDREVLAGPVERVTFHNAENGFCVLRIKARGHRELITVVGHAAVISAGEWVTASGEWVNDRNHGQQFRARFLKTSEPTSLDGIEKYLGSGMIRGIGPIYEADARFWREGIRYHRSRAGAPDRGDGHWSDPSWPYQSCLGRAEDHARNHGHSGRVLSERDNNEREP